MATTFMQCATTHDTLTENGALSNSSMGSALADQFAKAANYRGRKISEVFNDQSALWDEDKEKAMRFIFYLRLITRKIKVHEGFATEKVQNGQGMRDEAFKRLLWVGSHDSHALYSNLWLLPLIGSWKDLWTLLFYDIKEGINCLNHEVFFALIKEGLTHKEHAELIKKYMPRIKSKSKLNTDWTRISNQLSVEFAKFLGLTVKEYNKFKASGSAHDFQKQICGQMYDKINWGVIPGRALNILVTSKFIENHNLVDNYMAWLEKQPLAKYTGYVYELMKSCKNKQNRLAYKIPTYVRYTIDKQFESLIKTAKANGGIKENVLCALDTSGSMNAVANAKTKVTALDMCMSLGIFFSELNEGEFHNTVAMFDDTSRLQKLSGSFTDKLMQIPMNAMGSTNFRSIGEMLVRVRKENPTLPLEAFPTTILTVSDMQFNAREYCWTGLDWRDSTTNYEDLKAMLYEAFPREWVDNLKFVWWNVTDRTKDFPTTLSDGGSYCLSGFDGSIITMLLGEDISKKEKKTPKTMEELIDAALSQEILLQVSVE